MKREAFRKMKRFFKKIIVAILTTESRLIIRKYKPVIVAITGSVGKTTTKDAIYSVLSSSSYVRKSEKSYNSELGVPLTIIGCQSGWLSFQRWLSNILRGFLLIIFPFHYPKTLILEVGADRPGDIKSLTSWLTPDIAVFTAFADVPVHVEFFKDVDELVKEKVYLAKALKAGGVLVVNSDDERSSHFKEFAPKAFVISYGISGGATVRGSNYEIYYEYGFPRGIRFKVSVGGNTFPVSIEGSLGRQHMYSALSAVGVAISEKINLVRAAQSLQSFLPPLGRMKIIAGIKNSLIIDDTYNSSPEAAKVALETLFEIKSEGRRIAVLGDMLELGKFTAEAHKDIGVKATSADLIFTVGIRSRAIAEGALSSGFDESRIFQYENYESVGKDIEKMILPKDIILIKGSQGMRMEKIVEEIMAEPLLKERLLVRQEPEWSKR